MTLLEHHQPGSDDGPPVPKPGHCPTCRCDASSPAESYRDDPRWRLAQAEACRRPPWVDFHTAQRFRRHGMLRAQEIEFLYGMGISGMSPPSVPAGRWRSGAFRWLELTDQPDEIPWDPDWHEDLWSRITFYQLLMHLGVCETPQEAVKLLVEARRQFAEESARHLRKNWNERSRLGAQRYLARLKRAVMEAGGPCTYCNAPNPRTVDHIVPTTRGGKDHPRNLAICCLPCNSSKGDRTPEEWRAARLGEGLSSPPLPSGLKEAS